MKSIPLLLLLAVAATAAPNPSRQSVSLDIYNRDLAMVRDVRTVTLQKGAGTADFSDIADGIFGHTASVLPLDKADRISTRELTYNFDLVSQEKLMQRYVGRWFSFQSDDANYEGRLLGFDDKHLFLQPDTLDPALQVVQREKLSEMTYPDLPTGLFSRPTLRWGYQSDKSFDDVPVEISYLTGDVIWMCDYRGELIGDDSLVLGASFTISNDLQAEFPQAKVSLVVGKPHRSSDPEGRMEEERIAEPGAKSSGKANAEAERIGEFYRYALPNPIDLWAHQTIQTPFFAGRGIKAEKRYFFPQLLEDELVLTQLRIDKMAAAVGTVALPEGDIGIYRRTKDGELTFVGEDFIPITPSAGRVDLTVGAAADITARRVRLAQDRPSRDSHEETWQVTVTSGRSEAVTVWVEQRVFGYYTVTKSEVDGKAVNPEVEAADKINFPVKVPAGGKATLTVVIAFGF